MKKNYGLILSGHMLLACLAAGLVACGEKPPAPTPPPPPAPAQTAASPAKSLTEFSLAGSMGTINEDRKTVSLTVPGGTPLKALVAHFGTTGASVRVGSTPQTSNITPNDFSQPVTYHVVATDGSSAAYQVTVRVSPDSAKGDAPRASTAARMPEARDIPAAPVMREVPGAPTPSTKPLAVYPAFEYGELNDTGVSQCFDPVDGEFSSACAGTGQDGEFGRDALAAQPGFRKTGAGKAGFDWTKLGATGAPLPATASSWACVRDNVTGLTWENKTAENGALTLTNSLPAPENTDTAAKANAALLCGKSGWRLPTRDELLGIVDYSAAGPGPKIDTDFFQHTPPASVYWSSSSVAGSPAYAWAVDFGTGSAGYSYRGYAGHVRLVRSGK